jgi:cytochrome b subunit of formate dehydrogenase
MVFQILSILGLGLVIWWIFSSLKINSEKKNRLGEWIEIQFSNSWKSLKDYRNLNFYDFFNLFKKIIYLISLLCVLILGITGFLPVIVFGSHLSGILLIIHVSIAPIFAICLALMVLFWAHQHQFLPVDWIWFKNLFNQNNKKNLALDQHSKSGEKVGFWLLMVLSLPLILSILLSMFKFFGTVGQKFLLHLHGFSALLFLMVALVHTYLIILHHKH